MTRDDWFQFNEWLKHTTARSREPLMSRWPGDPLASLSVRIDPIQRMRNGLGMISEEVVSIPGPAGLADARRLVTTAIDRRRAAP
jgi:hypothetical protein